MAVDLREIIATIRISGDLERVGDLAKNIAKRAIKVHSEMNIPRATIGLRSMHESAAILLKDVLDAYAQRDAARARGVWTHTASTLSPQIRLSASATSGPSAKSSILRYGARPKRSR